MRLMHSILYWHCTACIGFALIIPFLVAIKTQNYTHVFFSVAYNLYHSQIWTKNPLTDRHLFAKWPILDHLKRERTGSWSTACLNTVQKSPFWVPMQRCSNKDISPLLDQFQRQIRALSWPTRTIKLVCTVVFKVTMPPKRSTSKKKEETTSTQSDCCLGSSAAKTTTKLVYTSTSKRTNREGIHSGFHQSHQLRNHWPI